MGERKLRVLRLDRGDMVGGVIGGVRGVRRRSGRAFRLRRRLARRFLDLRICCRAAALAAAASALTSACGYLENVDVGGGYYKVGKPYRVDGVLYRPAEVSHYSRVGTASWYGPKFHGKRTANGEIFDQYALTAAHPTLPLPSHVRVRNLENGRSLVVRVNDRGPFARGRLIDVSRSAAEMLDFRRKGTARVEVTYLGLAPLGGMIHDPVTRRATH